MGNVLTCVHLQLRKRKSERVKTSDTHTRIHEIHFMFFKETIKYGSKCERNDEGDAKEKCGKKRFNPDKWKFVKLTNILG